MATPLKNGGFPAELDYKNVASLKSAAAELKTLAYSTPSDDMTQDEHDAQVEQKITVLGKALAARAESLAGVRLNEMADLENEIETRVYAKHKEENGENSVDLAYEAESQARHNLREETDEVKKEALEKIYKEAVNKRNELQKQLDETYEEFTKSRSVMHENVRHKLSAAYRKVLSEMRDLGGDVDYNQSLSEDKAVELIQSTAGITYPAEWIELHNSNSPENQVYQFTDKRASYNAAIELDVEDGVEKLAPEYTYNITGGEEEMASLLEVLEKTTGKKNNAFSLTSQPWVGDSQKIVGTAGLYEQKDFYSAENGNHLSDEELKENGWVFSPAAASIYSHLPELPLVVDGEFSFDNLSKNISTPRWHKPKMTKKVIASKTVLYKEDATDLNDTENAPAYAKGVAIHEFGHRMEEVLPNNILPRQEKAFLLRRAGKDVEDANTNMKVINNSEFAHKVTGLVSDYTGRDYFTGKNYELFTTGVESLFGGDSYGGLVGASQKAAADFEHRGFVLGAMAVL